MLEAILPIDRVRALQALAEAQSSFGGVIELHASVPSTMPLAHALAARLAVASGAAVVAEAQEAGKGRAGRLWQAPPGRALLVSFMLRRAEHPLALESLPILSALAVAQAIEQMSIPEERIAIKWPNDILILNDAGNGVGKVAGILIETVLAADGGWQHAVLGMGINVNQRHDEMAVIQPPALPPTSMRLFFDALGTELFGVHAEMEGEIDRTQLLIFLCTQLDTLSKLDSAQLLALYRQRLWKPAVPMVAITPGQADPAQGITGMVEDVDAQGRLLLRDSSGTLHTLSSEEVSLRVLPA